MAVIDYLKPILEGYELVSRGNQYIGQCNKVRCNLDDLGKMKDQDEKGEKWWQFVMSKRKPVSSEEFEQKVGTDQIEDVLEYDNMDDYVADAQREDPDFGIYKSIDQNGDVIYFVQHGGFEFFWREK